MVETTWKKKKKKVWKGEGRGADGEGGRKGECKVDDVMNEWMSKWY